MGSRRLSWTFFAGGTKAAPLACRVASITLREYTSEITRQDTTRTQASSARPRTALRENLEAKVFSLSWYVQEGGGPAAGIGMTSRLVAIDDGMVGPGDPDEGVGGFLVACLGGIGVILDAQATIGPLDILFRGIRRQTEYGVVLAFACLGLEELDDFPYFLEKMAV